MKCSFTLGAAALAFCAPAQAYSLQTPPPSSSSLSAVNTMAVTGGGLQIGVATRICVSGDVTLSSGLDSVGVNAIDGMRMAGLLHGWMDQALVRHQQPAHMPTDRSAPRVVRADTCGLDDIALRMTVDPRIEGGPYRVRLRATQGAKVFTAEISRNGLVRAPPGVPVLADDRLPDGRPYWDVSTDITRALEAFEASLTWGEPDTAF